MALYNISSPSGKEGKIAGFIIGELRRMGIPFRQDRYGNIYAVKGNRESYPCVVAHMDEVHRRKTGSYAAHLVADSMIVGYDHKRKRMTGIGADDKNGIWICLKCLEDFKAVKWKEKEHHFMEPPTISSNSLVIACCRLLLYCFVKS